MFHHTQTFSSFETDFEYTMDDSITALPTACFTKLRHAKTGKLKGESKCTMKPWNEVMKFSALRMCHDAVNHGPVFHVFMNLDCSFLSHDWWNSPLSETGQKLQGSACSCGWDQHRERRVKAKKGSFWAKPATFGGKLTWKVVFTVQLQNSRCARTFNIFCSKF